MDKIIGNYLSQANKSFPVDCETLDYIAGNATLAEMLGNIAGDKMILYGCDAVNGGVSRKEGYVFLRTKDYPEGEVLRFEGGSTASGLHVVKEDISVSANGYSFPKAYTGRYLAVGYGAEQYSWDEFEEVKTNRSLWEALSDLQKAFREFSAEPLGIVKLWSGKNIPDGYHLCDGSQLLIAEYPALYKAIEKTFNSAKNAAGIPYTTDSGYFRLPDLRGRFVVGYHDSDPDYQDYGSVGGEKEHILLTDEMPSHDHMFFGDDQLINHLTKWGGKNVKEADGYDAKSESSGKSNVYTTSQTGEGTAHENRPPYYVLAYIMKLK